MANKSGGQSGGNSKGNTKIRFVLLEVDSSDSNLTEIAHAITNALRPSVAVPRPAPAAAALQAPRSAGNGEVMSAPAPDAVESDEDGQMGESPAPVDDGSSPTKAPRVRRYPNPTYLSDVDLTAGEVPFKQFAAQKAPKKNSKRYLVVAAWFKEYGGRATVNINHIYTCFRTAGWGTNIADWDMIFRSLVKQDWMRRVEPGEYAITPLGENELNDTGESA